MFDSERPDNTLICRGGLYLKIAIHVNPAYAWQAPKSERYVSKWRVVEERERHKEYSRNRTNNKMGKEKQKTNQKGGRTERKQHMSEKDQLITRRGEGGRERAATQDRYTWMRSSKLNPSWWNSSLHQEASAALRSTGFDDYHLKGPNSSLSNLYEKREGIFSPPS